METAQANSGTPFYHLGSAENLKAVVNVRWHLIDFEAWDENGVELVQLLLPIRLSGKSKIGLNAISCLIIFSALRHVHYLFNNTSIHAPERLIHTPKPASISDLVADVDRCAQRDAKLDSSTVAGTLRSNPL